jgi:ADP-ribose pyrophosphatase YjhB (NUDIX family)
LTQFGFFGPTEKHDTALGGFCISVFAMVDRGGKVLMLRPRSHPRWEQDWTPNHRIYDSIQIEEEMTRWRLPSTYVKLGESPREAVDRVMVDQLGVTVYSVGQFSLENFYEESRRYPGRMHWDYCFVFPVSTKEEVGEKDWISEAQYLDPKDVRGRVGSAQEYLLSRLKLV